jgi:molybdate transport system substrate-binding protein
MRVSGSPAGLLVAAALLLAILGQGCPKATSPSPAPVATTPGAQTPPAALTGKTLTVFAGAASKPALEELATMYEAKTGTKVAVTFGGSGAVLTQFSQEQYGDVYVPGSDDFMDKAEKKGAVVKGGRTILLYLMPALCVAKGNPKNVHDLKDLARTDLRVVIGQPKSVCLGDIGESILTQAGLWERVKPHIASYASSCEDTLNNLLLGEADVIIGWDVFARQHPDKVEAIPLPKELARTRNIPASVITWSKQPEQARAFIQFLASPESKDVFSRHGYTVKPEGAA